MAGTVAGLSIADERKSPTLSPKNFLFIVVDDLRPELGCYGRSHMVTPNIDRLAAKGIQFNRAYVQQASCAPSRASFLSGVNLESIGVDYPYSRYFVDEWLPIHDSLLTRFFKSGYTTLSIGKIHHTYPGFQLDQLSEPAFLPEGMWRYAAEENRVPRSPDAIIDKIGENTVAYEFVDASDSAYKDGAVTAQAIRSLRKLAPGEAPFFVAVGYYKPHLPLVAPRRFWDRYADTPETAALTAGSPPLGAPAYARKRLLGELTSHEHFNTGADEFATGRYTVNETFASNLRRAYFACVSFIDEQVGILLAELEELRLTQNTVVVLIGDHGWHLGENATWAKFTNWEYSTRAPLIIYDPTNPTSGPTEALVEFTDIYPTLLDIAGLPIPDHVEGTSLVPVLRQPDRGWKQAVFSRFSRGPRDFTEGANLMGHAIRTNDFRYIEWRDTNSHEVDAVELYHYEAHETETTNLAGRPEWAEVENDLAKRLAQGWRGALPKGIKPRSKNPPAPPPVAWGPESAAWRREQAPPTP